MKKTILKKVEAISVELATQKQMYASLDKLAKGQTMIDKGRNVLETEMKKAQGILSEVERQAKDLGVNPNDIKGYKSLNIEVQNTKSQYL